MNDTGKIVIYILSGSVVLISCLIIGIGYYLTPNVIETDNNDTLETENNSEEDVNISEINQQLESIDRVIENFRKTNGNELFSMTQQENDPNGRDNIMITFEPSYFNDESETDF